MACKRAKVTLVAMTRGLPAPGVKMFWKSSVRKSAMVACVRVEVKRVLII